MTENKEIVSEGTLNEIKTITSVRKNKTTRIQQCFEFCPSLTEQHSAKDTDLNYLIQKYQPDQLAAYMAARNQQRQEIIGHDFSQEPSLQEAKNELYRIKQAFEEIPEDIKRQFSSPTEFLKFIDNPLNAEKMVKMGLLSKEQIQSIQPIIVTTPPDPITPDPVPKQ